MSASPGPPDPKPATIRRATYRDFAAIGRLLSMRDARTWDERSLRWFLEDLDPERCLAWLAFRGDLPVAFSNAYLRELTIPGATARAAYWANLFIDPAHRDLLLYPRLPLVMFSEVRSLGLEFLYGSVRLRDLARAHTRIGFASLGTVDVVAKPLRPARLIAKLKGWALATPLAPPIDALYALPLAWTRPGDPAGLTVTRLTPDAVAQARVLEALNHGSQPVRRVWSAGSLRRRYLQTREDTAYTLLGVHRDRELTGVVTYRIGERGAGIRAGVIMDAIAVDGDARTLMPALVAAERHAYAEGCELMMCLNGLGPEVALVLRSAGYRPTPERYEMLVWPREAITALPEIGQAANWRLGFADHDAF